MKKKIFQANILQRLWTRLLAQKKDNKGSTIVTVIVTMAIVMVLVTIVLSTSLMNFYMKTNDTLSTSNFYGAEAALEEIRMGLAVEVSRAMSSAYNQVLTEYENSTSIEKKVRFKALFSKALEKVLSAKDDDGKLVAEEYDPDMLKGYLRDTYPKTNEDGIEIGAYLVESTVLPHTLILNGDDGVTLKNVDVRYNGEDGYVDEIKTDILLAYPDVSFVAATSTPDLASYCIVAGQGPTDEATGTVGASFVASGNNTVQGNVYLGENDATLGGILNFKKLDGDTQPGSYRFIVGGDANLGSELNIADYDVWSKSLNLKGSKLTETGVCTTNLSNDLVLDGAGSNAKLVGEYYGFGIDEGNGAAPGDSSAVIVNGTSSNLDMSTLTKMIVGGVAYVDRKSPGYMASATEEESTTSDVMTGETVSIKPNQRAYLVPLDLVGIGYNNGGFNPMRETDFTELCKEVTEDLGYNEEYVKASELVSAQGVAFEVGKIDATIAPKDDIQALVDELNKKYSDAPYYIEGDDTKGYVVMAKGLAQIGADTYKIYHTQGIREIHKLVYLFMSFDTVDHANGYYKLYSSLAAQKQRLEGNTSIYVGSEGIKMPTGVTADPGVLTVDGETALTEVSFYYKGSLIDNTSGVSVYDPNVYETEKADGSLVKSEKAANDAMSQLIARRNSYNGLTHKLVEDILSPEELAKSVFENLIDEDAMDGNGIDEDRPQPLVMKIADGSVREFVTDDENKYKCRIVRQENYDFSDGVVGGKTNVCLIISTGNVNIKGDYNGLVIAKGKITVEGNYNIKSDSAAVLSVLTAMDSQKVCPGYYLQNYESYIDLSDEEDKGVLKELEYVKYANWQKK